MSNKIFFLIAAFFGLSFTAVAQINEGLVAYYKFANNLIDSVTKASNAKATAAKYTTDRSGKANAAFYFDGAKTTVEIPRLIENDFTVCFWFKTSQKAQNGKQWYQGKGLVDAEVCGVTNDWGITLIDEGKVCFGVGGPDVTIKSTLNYNDNQWHFVVAKRTQSTSLIELYVDNVLTASAKSKNTKKLDAPKSILFGNDFCQTYTSLYKGALDDVRLYDRLISEEEATVLFTLR